MSRTTTAPARRAAEDYSELPTIRGLNGALRFVQDELRVPWVTANALPKGSESGQLKSFMINRGYSYSERDLYQWILSLARGGDA
ncbi:hypothetical protein IU468_28475 [Nocardia farcinica]|uniref:hypothetical protein n=1 Tax=Nocardia farcinica TaxID=37329 RepID=UPI0018930754|nr:hypothetical protein [Nocardia farcinica]MBF6260199.1 hypothetical protein [Nocardia farcinica]MBF6270738.1 hypothetical protein [Nocardia farcinica]